MGRISLCLGKYAKTPFFMEKVYVNLYSVEELCYCLMRDAYLIEPDIMDGRLAVWLSRECGLEELAVNLTELEKAGCTVGEYAGAILEYAGYSDYEERVKAVETMEKGRDLSLFGKRKMHADYLADHKRYMAALRCYAGLLEELPAEEREIRAKILHNEGVVYAELFRFQSAAQCFRQAFEYGGGEEEHVCFLAANRMMMGQEEYVDFAAGYQGHYGLALEVEKLIEEAGKDFEGTEESRMLFTLGVCREENQSVSYYDETERIVHVLKEHYREITAE